jgi:KaiC/GvpD/RAD55 family RecA-like ATPase
MMGNGAEGNTIPRIQTGVPGLDKMLYGGVPIENQVVIAGGPGSGKTLLSFEILYHNAKQGIPCAFIAFEERPLDMLRNVKNAYTEFSDIDEVIKSKSLIVEGEELPARMENNEGSDTYSFGNVISYIEEIVQMNDAKIVAIDSVSLLKLLVENTKALSYRRSIVALMSNLRRLRLTAFLTVEMNSVERQEFRFSPEFFVFDGVVAMYQTGLDEKRAFNLEIIKMRGTNHSFAFAPYEVTSKGFRIFTIDE